MCLWKEQVGKATCLLTHNVLTFLMQLAAKESRRRKKENLHVLEDRLVRGVSTYTWMREVGQDKMGMKTWGRGRWEVTLWLSHERLWEEVGSDRELDGCLWKNDLVQLCILTSVWYFFVENTHRVCMFFPCYMFNTCTIPGWNCSQVRMFDWRGGWKHWRLKTS